MSETRFEQAYARLASRLIGRDGRTVKYQQGSIIIEGNKAVPSDEVYNVINGDGMPTKIQSTDWIWTTADLADLTPLAGDRISYFKHDIEYIYEVLPIENLPCSEWHDNAGTMTVIHTKRIK